MIIEKHMGGCITLANSATGSVVSIQLAQQGEPSRTVAPLAV
jgi:hypothetical protein